MDRYPYVCMDNNSNYIKHIRHVAIIMHFLRNGEDWNLQNIVWWEGGLKFADKGTKNVREDALNPRLGYAMVKLENW